MCRHSIGAEAAFQPLSDHSQHNGRKLIDVAAAVVRSHLLLAPQPADIVSSYSGSLPNSQAALTTGVEQIGHRRTVAVGLLAVVSVANALALVALIGSLLNGEERSGAELLLKGFTISRTDVIVFGLWFGGWTGAGRFDGAS